MATRSNPSDIPEEDLLLFQQIEQESKCQHEYVDVYDVAGVPKDGSDFSLVWVYCKHCLDKKLLRFDMRQFKKEDDL